APPVAAQPPVPPRVPARNRPQPAPRPPAIPEATPEEQRRTSNTAWLALIAVLAVVGSVSWLLLSDTFGEAESEPIASAN
ncbi:MAG: hypothetical protein ACC652_14220, partial [Acidimicrobiales bacterium]